MKIFVGLSLVIRCTTNLVPTSLCPEHLTPPI
ncbi:hypothetical protein Z043_102930 [Scleropages formosus]|uniref:Uncharacterized protein n=1 Tax=Scleropages formosus TaxID=113540 RepID=A0A0P7V6D1_SCLFO|nr:hypothetical protein Z043_102930 [Scleropages formosus]